MGQLLLIVVVAVTIAAVVFGVTVLVSGRDAGLQPAEPDGRAIPLPATRPLQESDLGDVRFDLASRGYRMAQVDQALRRAAYDIGYKDELIGVLEAEVTALREGRTLDADALRRAREAAQAPSTAAVAAGGGEPGKPGWSEFTRPAESDTASTAYDRDIEVVAEAPVLAAEPPAESEPPSAPVVEEAAPTAPVEPAESAAEPETAADGAPESVVSPVLAAESQFGEEDADAAEKAAEPYPVTEPYGGPAAEPLSETAPKANPSAKSKKAKTATNATSVGAGTTSAEDAGSARR